MAGPENRGVQKAEPQAALLTFEISYRRGSNLERQPSVA
jgi:hypothetical protein